MVSSRRAGGGKGKAADGGKGKTVEAADEREPADGVDEVTECRFKHLLEPIRDLALNWNIDIAQELEHYLGQLEMVQVTLDGGGSFLNFAEAALLIQGTTCVYSRKVEYLHRLVLQVLDVIDHKLSTELRKDAAAEGEQDAEGAFQSDPEFISLDDIPEAKSAAIDMAEKNDEAREVVDDDLTGGPLVVMMNIEVDNDNPGTLAINVQSTRQSERVRSHQQSALVLRCDDIFLFLVVTTTSVHIYTMMFLLCMLSLP